VTQVRYRPTLAQIQRQRVAAERPGHEHDHLPVLLCPPGQGSCWPGTDRAAGSRASGLLAQPTVQPGIRAGACSSQPLLEDVVQRRRGLLVRRSTQQFAWVITLWGSRSRPLALTWSFRRLVRIR
jgi:hypothetical protein